MRGKRLRNGTAATLLLALLLGCGGYRAATSGGRAKGRATIHVKWPVAARLIPASSQSLAVSVSKDGKVVGSALVVRPTASATLTGLPFGSLDVTVKVLPNVDGTGVAQAVGAGTMKVTEDVPGVVNIAPESTVATLSLASAPLAFVVGGAASVTVSAADASGAMVPLSTAAGAETLVWTVAPASVASVSGSGPTVVLAGLAAGNATLTAALKVKDDGTTVTSSALPLRVSPALVTAGLPTSGWPTMGGDYGADGRGRGPRASANVGGAIVVGPSGGPAFAVTGPDGTVYAVGSGKIVAQSPAGVPLRSTDRASGYITGLALSASGGLFASTSTGLEAYRADTGALAWTFVPDNAILSQASLGRDGTVFVFTPDKLYAVNPTDGAVLWSQTASLSGRLAIGADGTLFGHNGATVFAFDPTTGAPKWSEVAYKVDAQGSDLSIVGDTLYLVTGLTTTSSSRAVARFGVQASTMESEAAYQADIPLDEAGNALVPGGRVNGTGNTNGTTGTTFTTGRTTGRTAGTTAGTTGGPVTHTYYTYRSVVALNAADGGQKWAYDLPRASSTGTSAPSYSFLGSAPVVSNGVVVAQTHGCVVGLDVATGAKLWIDGSPLAGSPTYWFEGISIAADGTAYVPRFDATLADGSALQAIDPATGTILWTAPLGGPTYGFPTVSDDGTVYVGTTSGKVVPIR